MGRKIFRERDFNPYGKVLSSDKFELFKIIDGGFKINEEHFPKIIQYAEEALSKEPKALIASEYMMFKRDGNRSVFEGKYFERRRDLLTLALGEYVEGKGRFLDKVIDLLWLVLEETTWVVPAHNQDVPGINTCLPAIYEGEIDWIDLFSGGTGATVAWVYYLLHDKFDEVTTIINERILFELDRRIIKPFLNPVHLSHRMWWSGMNGHRVNNWCPWIVSNVLTVCALTVTDLAVRESVVATSLPLLDNFIETYKTDGGCEEGPSYFDAAGGALINACFVLYDMTDGYINIFDDELIRKMGEYEVKACINDNRFMNFADCPGRIGINNELVYMWGKLTNSEMMMNFAQSRMKGKLCDSKVDINLSYRSFAFLCLPKLPVKEYVAPTKFYLDGIKIAATRETSDTAKGLYIAFKGGNNDESHNHNDLGTVTVFADAKPIFLDAGSGKYTRLTFSSERYNIWAMSSEYHNTATLNGVIQKAGKQYHSSDEVYDEKTGKFTMSLKNAYPEEANIKEYTKSAVLENSTITIEDKIEYNDEGDVIFNFLVNEYPEVVNETSFKLHGRTITYDPSLVMSCEDIDSTQPETCGMPHAWECEVLKRIRLKSKDKFKARNFTLTIK